MKRELLGCCIIAGPLFVVASLAQASTRTGFDLGRHPISLLSLGSLGWLPGRGSTWAPRLVAITGVGLIVAGVFTTDAGAGFPPGAPAGAPTMSWHGVLHEIGFGLSFVGAIAACGVFARRYAALGRRGWAVTAIATVVAVLVIVGWPDLNTLSVRLVIATAALFGFLSAVAARLFGQAREPAPVAASTLRRLTIQG